MGWYFNYGKPEDIKAEITRLFEPKWVPVQISKVGNTWYVAATRAEVTLAFVVLTKVTDGDWGYKDMDETMGPYEAKAPKSLIAKLSPTENKHSLDWRQRCLDYAARPKWKYGDKIVLNAPVYFKGHPPQTHFIRTDKHWYNASVGLCRLGSYSLAGATKQ